MTKRVCAPFSETTDFRVFASTRKFPVAFPESFSKGLLSLESIRFLPSLCRLSRRAARGESERENVKERSRMVNAPNVITDIIFSTVEKEGRKTKKEEQAAVK